MCSFFEEKNGGLDFAQPEVSERDETKIHSMCIYMYVCSMGNFDYKTWIHHVLDFF